MTKPRAPRHRSFDLDKELSALSPRQLQRLASLELAAADRTRGTSRNKAQQLRKMEAQLLFQVKRPSKPPQPAMTVQEKQWAKKAGPITVRRATL